MAVPSHDRLARPGHVSPNASSSGSAAEGFHSAPTLDHELARSAETPAIPPAQPHLGQTIGKYQLLEELGVGGMGVVYKAFDPHLKRLVAIKRMRWGSPRAEEMDRFCKEGEALARVKHPNVVPIHDAGQHDGQPFFVMELLAGGNLARRVRLYHDPRAAVMVVEKIARAVHFLHEQNMLHRDLKPANVLLDGSGEPFISDFGLVKLLDQGVDLTRTSQRVGTPAYMAPEQTGLVQARLSPATDVWAIGIILFELLAGRRPFAAPIESDLFQQIVGDDPPSLCGLRPELDPGLEAVIARCLAKEPGQRFASAQELADELARWSRGEPLQTRPEGRLRRLRRHCRRHPLLTAAVVVLALIAAAATVAVIWLDPDRPLRALDERLSAGETVELIDGQGRPVWHRWRLNQKAASTWTTEGAFSVRSDDCSLLDLVVDPKTDSFRLRAQVRHERGDLQAQAGLYVLGAGTTVPADRDARRVVHSFIELTFNETAALSAPRKNPVRFRPRLLVSPGSLDIKLGGFSPRLVAPAGLDGGDWNALQIDVSPSNMTAFWNGISIGAFSSPTNELAIQNSLRRRSDSLTSFDFPLSPRQGVGLIVNRGTASFRNVVIEPQLQ